MGSEDLFKKRKAAGAERLHRNKIGKAGKETALIVCEDSKAEPTYFKALLRDLGLGNRVRLGDIRVDDRKQGLEPSKLLDRAIDLFWERRASGATYDHVYCVFDKDCHTNYEPTRQRIERQPLREKRGDATLRLATMTAITSVPCFEVWLLLHFTSSPPSCHGSGRKSPCDQVLDEFKRYPELSNYQKNDPRTYEKTKGKLEIALANAERIWKQKEAKGDNPSTRVFELVAYLKLQATA